jgi:hypothetical protein
VDANEAAAPTANGILIRGGRPRLRSRATFSPVAPTITGSATWRESRFASSRANRRNRAATSVAPLRDTPGIKAHACATPSISASTVSASSWSRSCGLRSAYTIAAEPASSPSAIVGGVPR